MFVMCKTSKTAINLCHIKVIEVEFREGGYYLISAWTLSNDRYTLARFRNEEEANRYLEMICKEYNLLWRER